MTRQGEDPMERSQDGTLDELIERYVTDVRAGHAPSVDAIARAHPHLADDLRSLLPAAVAVENAVAAAEQPTESFPGLKVLFEIAPGRGGMGRVYAARDTSLDRIVAVKTKLEHMRTPEGREFFVREARAAAGLDHPNIVKVYHFDPDHAPPYFVMQYVDGQPLDEACEGRDAVLIARIVEQIARGLAYAHERGIVHRDVKPANVLVSADGVPHITDFGLSKMARGEVQGEPGVSSMKGTPRYMAPEVFTGDTDGGPSLDIYALGVTLYELLCHRPAFAANNMPELIADVLANEPELPQKIAPTVPEALQRICLKAIEKRPEDRYSSALDMADDLRRFCTGDSVRAQPKRYLRAIRGKLQTQMTEIRLWREQNLISTEVADRLLRPYRLTLQDDSPWSRLSRSHPLATMVLRIAGVALVVSTILWPLHYWPDLASPLRVLAVCGPTILINAVGWALYARGGRQNAAVFLSIGLFLVPLLAATILTELVGVAAFDQGPSIELLDEGFSFRPTNVQIAIALLATLWYSAFTLMRARVRMLSTWTGVMGYLSYAAVLLVCGAKEWLENEQVALAVLTAIPASLAFIWVSYRTRSFADGAWSTILFVGFPLPFAVLMTLLARFATEEWLGAGNDWDEVPLQVLLMANGLLYFVAAMLCRRGWSAAVRFWSPFFLTLTALSFITPAHVAFEKGIELSFLGRVGLENVTGFEIVAFAAPVVFTGLGIRLRRGALVIPGLIGFGVFLLRFTDRHFDRDAYWRWALALAVVGAAAMIAATARIILRERRARAPRP